MPKRMIARVLLEERDWDSKRWAKVTPLPLSPAVEEAVADEIAKIAPIWEDHEPEVFLRRCGCGRRSQHRWCATCFKAMQETVPVSDPEAVKEILARLKKEFADRKKARTVYINGGKPAIKAPKPVRGP